MATIARGSKSAGGTSFVDGTVIEADEVNTDFDTVYNAVNAGLDNANINTAAAIELSKLDGYSDTAAEMATETTPGVTGGTSAASTMQAELERLRYKLKEIGTGTSTKRLDGTASVDLISWFDTPQVGPNLIQNGNFAIGLESSVPFGWTNVNTATLALTTAGKTEGQASMRALRITAAGGTNEGVQQTLAGLKASTKYVVGCRAKATSGDTFRLVTTGADGAVFGNLDLSTTSTSYVTLAGVIVTDSTPTDIVVQLLAAADTDIVDVTHVWVRECATDRLPFSSTPWHYQEITGVTNNHYVANTLTDSGLSLAVVAPGPGYQIEVVSSLTFNSPASGSTASAAELQENGTTVDVIQTAGHSNGGSDAETFQFNYVKRDPTPGTTYTYTVVLAGTANSGRNTAALFSGTATKTWMRVRAVLSSGGH